RLRARRVGNEPRTEPTLGTDSAPAAKRLPADRGAVRRPDRSPERARAGRAGVQLFPAWHAWRASVQARVGLQPHLARRLQPGDQRRRVLAGFPGGRRGRALREELRPLWVPAVG